MTEMIIIGRYTAKTYILNYLKIYMSIWNDLTFYIRNNNLLYFSIVFLDYANGFALDINELDTYLMTYLDKNNIILISMKLIPITSIVGSITSLILDKR